MTHKEAMALQPLLRLLNGGDKVILNWSGAPDSYRWHRTIEDIRTSTSRWVVPAWGDALLCKGAGANEFLCNYKEAITLSALILGTPLEDDK